MIQRRHAEENVISCLSVMLLLNDAGVDQCLMVVKDGFRESGGS
jgi:hypothetical protein